MPSQVISSVENNFTKGLLTEFSGLNFPENAATDADNCHFSLIGTVARREGIDWETNAFNQFIDRTNQVVSTYKWNNAGGDGQTQMVVEQIGAFLYFYRSSSATNSSPLSAQRVASIALVAHAVNGVFDATQECTYTDGNGYLFVFHPSCDPFYCAYDLTAHTVTATDIVLLVRDFDGIAQGESVTARPVSASSEHLYNLVNQGWGTGPTWSSNTSTSWVISVGAGKVFTVSAGLTITIGQSVSIQSLTGAGIPGGTIVASGTVTAYAGTNLTLTVTTIGAYGGFTSTSGFISPLNVGTINTFKSVTGVYPSNADVWWYFKNASGVFDPATTLANVTLGGQAPRGAVIFSPFSQTRSLLTGISGLTDIATLKRPSNGAWFAGRIWYTGVNASQAATGDASQYSWSENIYFSQIVNNVNDLGHCYQTNDPTSETLSSLLPTDGGVLNIQGCGNIFKLFALQNALIIFAANGVWYLTGSQGIGFTANDYTIVKLSSVRSLSSTSFVDIKGLPMFWNEEGIYSVQPAQQGTSLLNSPLHVNPLEVIPITVGTIQSFYDAIPLQSKKYVRGAYNPIDYVVQWIYRSTNENSVTDRYTYDRILNYNVYNKAFYPYSLNTSLLNTPTINGIIYVASPGGTSGPASVFKYVTSYVYATGLYRFTFADEHDAKYVDWSTLGSNVNYDSYFITGYKLHGQGQKRFSIPYIYVYSANDTPHGYYVQSIWDYAGDPNSGRWSNKQSINNFKPRFTNIFRRIRLRGNGLVMQIKISSQDRQPFEILGWATYETMNQGV